MVRGFNKNKLFITIGYGQLVCLVYGKSLKKVHGIFLPNVELCPSNVLRGSFLAVTNKNGRTLD